MCILTLKPSPRPRFVVENGQELFYVRTGNATNALNMSELLGYYQSHWPAGRRGPGRGTVIGFVLGSLSFVPGQLSFVLGFLSPVFCLLPSGFCLLSIACHFCKALI